MPQPRGARRARNDERILAAARAVFVADPSAPIAAVARHAGVGMSALYARYASKEDLLRALCADGLRRYIGGGGVRPRGRRRPVGALRGLHARRGRGRRQHADPAPGRHVRADARALAAAAEAGRLKRRALRGGPATRARSAPTRASTTSRSSSSRSPPSASATRSAPGELRRRSLALALDGLRARGDGPCPGRPPPTRSSPRAGRRRRGHAGADDERPGAAARAREHEVPAHADRPQARARGRAGPARPRAARTRRGRRRAGGRRPPRRAARATAGPTPCSAGARARRGRSRASATPRARCGRRGRRSCGSRRRRAPTPRGTGPARRSPTLCGSPQLSRQVQSVAEIRKRSCSAWWAAK